MAQHPYRGSYNSRAQRSRSKIIKAVQPVSLERLEILTKGLPCAICGTRVSVVRVPVEHTLCEACAKLQEA